MRDLMLDIETFGTGRDAAIVSIGAVFFDPFEGVGQGVADRFHAKVDLARSFSPGTLDAGTVEFWLKQSDAARESLLDPEFRLTLEKALSAFSTFVYREARGKHSGGGIVKGGTLWSNGPLFDERIMREAFERHGMLFPLHFRASRCCRTIFAMAKQAGWDPKSMVRGGTHHDALDDAVYQAEGVVAMYRHLNITKDVQEV